LGLPEEPSFPLALPCLAEAVRRRETEAERQTVKEPVKNVGSNFILAKIELPLFYHNGLLMFLSFGFVT
jgi:hypothetical protein